MNRRFKISMILFLFFLINFYIPHAYARGRIFIVKPMQEMIENVDVVVSNKTFVNVCGNISVAKGFIDFYITSPSRSIILYYNRTSFNWFNFSATENGTYTLHLANNELENDVIVTLNYGVNFEVVLQATINLTWHTVGTWQTTITTHPSPIPVDKILRIIKQILDALNACGAGDALLAFTIWNIIKRMRKGRPRDYHGVEWCAL